jgi:predicted AAA+ superfamily ATPase
MLQQPDRSFFLFGPRGTGKSTWLQQVLPSALRLDLLDSSLYLELSRDPHRLEALVGSQPTGAWIVLDEIQKIPALLDEVHRLMELKRWRFALCGSSARKLKRGGANLLAGRALTAQEGQTIILCSQHLRCFKKALLFEMGVENKRIPDSQSAHDFETDAIDKAQVSF